MKKDDCKIGTPVTYWGVIKKDSGEKYDPIDTVITSEPWQLGHGAYVCKVNGVSGGVCLTHIEKRKEGEFRAFKFKIQVAELLDAIKTLPPHDNVVGDMLTFRYEAHGMSTDLKFSKNLSTLGWDLLL